MKKYMDIREETNQRIGSYLGKLIDSRYRKRSDFYREYLMHEGIKPDSEEVRKMGNRFSQIFIGEKKGLQIHDLLIVTDILGISCEELLTCGKAYRPVSGHMTNYEIAFSKNPKIWKKYMASEDNLFLNSDEYGKTVVDYALDFKNYSFIHWLMDEGYISFDEEKWYGTSLFLAKTKMKRRDIRFIDSDFPPQVTEEEQLRTKLVALAIENGDIKIMEEMKGREIPLLYEMTYVNVKPEDRYLDDERMIEAISCSNNEKIFDYFSEEFQIVTRSKCVGQYLYPNLGYVIDSMLGNKEANKDVVRMLIRRVVEHNKRAYNAITKKAQDFYEESLKTWSGDILKDVDDFYKKQTMILYHFDADTNVVSFMDTSADGVRTNAIPIIESSNIPSLKSLIEEANEWYEKLAGFAENFIHTEAVKKD